MRRGMMKKKFLYSFLLLLHSIYPITKNPFTIKKKIRMTDAEAAYRLRKKVFVQLNAVRTYERNLALSLQTIDQIAVRRKLGNLAFWFAGKNWRYLARMRQLGLEQGEKPRLFEMLFDDLDYAGMAYLLSFDTSYLFSVDEEGNTPLHKVIIKDDSDHRVVKTILLFLAFGADAHLYNYHGKTPYSLDADLRKSLERRILPDLTTPPPNDYKQHLEDLLLAINYTCEAVFDLVAEMILEKGKYFIERSVLGETLLHTVVSYSMVQHAKALLDYGYDPNSYSEKVGTALDIAQRNHASSLVQLLKRNHAKNSAELKRNKNETA